MSFHSHQNQNTVTMLRQRKGLGSRSPLSWLLSAQLVLSILSFMTACAVLGTSAHSFSVYVKGRSANNPWWLPLWPQHFYTRNTQALIGSAAGVVLLNLVFLVLSLLPKVRDSILFFRLLTKPVKVNLSSKPLVAAITTVGFALPAFFLALFSIVFNSVLNKRTTNSDTIQSWTCRFDKSMPIQDISIPGTFSNGQFGMICLELVSSLYGHSLMSVLNRAHTDYECRNLLNMLWLESPRLNSYSWYPRLVSGCRGTQPRMDAGKTLLRTSTWIMSRPRNLEKQISHPPRCTLC